MLRAFSFCLFRRTARYWAFVFPRHDFYLALAVVAVAWLVLPGVAQAQGWPEYPLPGPHSITRGNGNYISWLKLGLLFLLFVLWVMIVDWVNRDTQEYDLPHAIWNPVTFFPFFIALFLCGLTLPLFPLGFALTALALFVPTLSYVFSRNSQLEYHERVLTASHLRHVASARGKAIGLNIAAEAKAAHEKGAPVKFKALGAKNDQADQANLIASRQAPGFLAAKQLIANAVDHRADKIMLDFAPEEVKSRYQVDGVWHDSDGHDRDEGDQLLAVFKRLAAQNPDERRARQQGKFVATYERKKLKCGLVAQGTKSGERAIVNFEPAKGLFSSLADLGMREQMVDEYKSFMLSDRGVVLLSAMKGGGLTTTLSMSLSSTDRLLRDFVSLEEKSDPLPEIENVDPVYYDASKGETPVSILDPVMRKQPDVLVFPSLPDTDSAIAAVEAAKEHFLVFATINAKEAVEALLRVLLLKVPAKDFAPRVVCVLNQRLIRTLCETCKEAYEPQPSLLKKLGIPAGRVEQLFRHPEEPEKVCADCHGIGYRGRTGIFELLKIDNTIREVLIKQPKLDILRKAARKGGNRTLQEEGILAVVSGSTSLPELMRVLKQ